MRQICVLKATSSKRTITTNI